MPTVAELRAQFNKPGHVAKVAAGKNTHAIGPKGTLKKKNNAPRLKQFGPNQAATPNRLGKLATHKYYTRNNTTQKWVKTNGKKPNAPRSKANIGMPVPPVSVSRFVGRPNNNNNNSKKPKTRKNRISFDPVGMNLVAPVLASTEISPAIPVLANTWNQVKPASGVPLLMNGSVTGPEPVATSSNTLFAAQKLSGSLAKNLAKGPIVIPSIQNRTEPPLLLMNGSVNGPNKNANAKRERETRRQKRIANAQARSGSTGFNNSNNNTSLRSGSNIAILNEQGRMRGVQSTANLEFENLNGTRGVLHGTKEHPVNIYYATPEEKQEMNTMLTGSTGSSNNGLNAEMATAVAKAEEHKAMNAMLSGSTGSSNNGLNAEMAKIMAKAEEHKAMNAMLSGSTGSSNNGLNAEMAKAMAKAEERKAMNAMLSGSTGSSNNSLNAEMAKAFQSKNNGTKPLSQENINRKAKILSSC